MQLDLGTILGIAGIVLGAILSYYFYRVSLREKKPSWTVRSIVLIEDFCEKFENLKVLYNNENVANLTVSKIAFWNEGRETIDRNDIDTLNHLRISCIDGAKILDAKVLTTNNPSSQFSVNLSDDRDHVLLDFDYIDNKQGSVIQVVHTGRSSYDLEIVGDIKGVKNLENRFADTWLVRWLRSKLPEQSRNLIEKMQIGLGFFALIAGIIFFIKPDLFYPESKFAIGIITGIYLGMSASLFYIGFSGLKRIVPKGLEVFYE